ncbi:MAG: PAS domain-containing protein [Phycisphaerae bacterium]|nr:PAS domain-containing protein [Phycisphaerae bacterium]
MKSRQWIILVALAVVALGAVALIVWPNLRADHALSLHVVVGAPLLVLCSAALGWLAPRWLAADAPDRLAEHLEAVVRDGRLDDAAGVPAAGGSRLLSSLGAFMGAVHERLEVQQLALREEQIRTRILQADKQHMQAVLNSISDAVLVTNAFGDVTLANGAAEDVWNFTFEAERRTPVADVAGDVLLTQAMEQLRQSEHRVPRKVIEIERGTDGDLRIYKATVSAVRSEQGEGSELSGMVVVLHDVTREREMARMKNDFVSKVTHELRTPLSSIRAYVEMLVEGEAEEPETRNEFYKIIDSESDRLSRMIDNILNISRIEAGVTKVQKENLALTGLLKNVVEVLTPQAGEKHQVLEAELSPVFYQVFGDRDMLYQAILNVVSNAIKYTPEGGSIRLSSDLVGGMAVVKVADTGLGIPKDDLPRLFQKFYRVGVNKGAAKGTGLGLALVKEIVETLHHGKVSVESEVGKGTTFVLQLPVAE